MPPPSQGEILNFPDAIAWEAWLAGHHRDHGEVWLLIAKKGFEKKGMVIGDALDVALCYGWIDSHRRSHDQTHYLQRYSPRRSKSPWSLLNVKRAEALIEVGRMREAGFAEIAAAQADGRWAAAYGPQSRSEIPADVTAALARHGSAEEAFGRLSKSAQYVHVLPLLKATSAEVRERRLRKLIALLEASRPNSGS
ncbi:MAG: hypothetical protein JWO82_2628 [Akkermansiaceae bacterium]|nr:hypothetical protein [Akkermansiaceae bacterium]